MAAHACLKNEFTEDRKCHNLIRRLNFSLFSKLQIWVSYWHNIQEICNKATETSWPGGEKRIEESSKEVEKVPQAGRWWLTIAERTLLKERNLLDWSRRKYGGRLACGIGDLSSSRTWLWYVHNMRDLVARKINMGRKFTKKKKL